MYIAVCVASYKRLDGLQKLLSSLVDQRGLDSKFGIIVIDNDPEGSAENIVREFNGHSIEIRYDVEPEPGIPAARNRGVTIARGAGAAIVAFIDDDESATPYWLSTMYHRLETSGADAISGPVEPIFPSSAPRWVRTTRLFHRSTFPDGASLDYASTANSMLRLEVIGGIDKPFNPAFQFTGGTDSFLYRSLTARGKTIVWEPGALVYEDVPASRLSLRWILARNYRQGITLARCDVLIFGHGRTTLVRGIRGAVQVPIGMVQCVLSLIRRDDHWRRGLARISRGIGVTAGLFGQRYEEYARADLAKYDDT